jgi:cell division protein FtsL
MSFLNFKNKAIVVLVLILLTALIMLWLWQSWQEIRLTREIRETKEGLVPVEERNKELRIRVIEIFSLDRIERIAKSKLGMVEPEIKKEEEPEE